MRKSAMLHLRVHWRRRLPFATRLKTKQRAFNEYAAILGIDDASTLSAHCQTILKDFEDEKKREKICYDFRNVRAVVMCTAWKEMEDRHISFREAISAAWAEVKSKCADVGAYI